MSTMEKYLACTEDCYETCGYGEKCLKKCLADCRETYFGNEDKLSEDELEYVW